MTTGMQPHSRILAVPGATLTYDVREGASGELPLLLIGSPMGAGGFATLASHFPERTVVTYDPRGIERSVRDDPGTQSTPQQHADDLHRIIEALGSGPVDLFASSGGAVNALALVAAQPADVRTLVAHEPPLVTVLPDREGAMAATQAAADAYLQRGLGAGMARFIAIVGHQGPFSEDDATAPDPDPAMFGLPTEDDGGRLDPLLYGNLISCTFFEPDFDALRSAPTRIVLGAGVESEGQLANRSAHAVAERLGQTAVPFPSDHGGFLGGEYGQAGDPDGFAARLREVLAGL